MKQFKSMELTLRWHRSYWWQPSRRPGSSRGAAQPAQWISSWGIIVNILENFDDSCIGYQHSTWCMAAVSTLSPRLWMTGWCCTTTTALTAPSSSLLTPHCNNETWIEAEHSILTWSVLQFWHRCTSIFNIGRKRILVVTGWCEYQCSSMSKLENTRGSRSPVTESRRSPRTGRWGLSPSCTPGHSDVTPAGLVTVLLCQQTLLAIVTRTTIDKLWRMCCYACCVV